MKYVLLVCLSLFLLNCQDSKTEKRSAETIINTAIEVSGGKIINSSTIDFDFRDMHYKAIRDRGVFQFERQFRDSTSIKDVLNNNGFQRFVNDFPMAVPDSMAVKYSASVNSVHYFSVLPFGLNNDAVNKEQLKDMSIKNKSYQTIKVTFNQDGGGEDFEDVFMYWIHPETHKVDYLAYSYSENDGKGLRFREAYNERYIEGIRFVDYNNFKPEDETIALTSLPQLFESGTLKLLSKIELEGIVVIPNL
jgi:hypothetical protein